MKKQNFIILIFLSVLLISCAKEKQNKTIINEKDLNLQVLESYQEGLKELEQGYALLAAKKFNEVEILFPQSEWAPKSSLMAAYAYYTQNYFDDSIAELNRFLRVYPLDKNIDYAYYLLAISHYEKIVDEKKDLQSITNSKKNFEILKNKYPNTEYALDAEFKLGLINDILASKEMYIARYYVEKKKWIPAINRFKTVINNYETTIYSEEAIHRLVEIYYILGLENEAQKYAQLLGYNYQSSQWYEKTYIIFNQNYEKKIDKLKNKKSSVLIKKIKSLLSLDE
jgi:outer membrane protein assembly factor BamD